MPWVKNASRPNHITHGLEGRHVALWASHGRYYDHVSMEWKWQRPSLFCTNEDLFTQTIVVPYLIPMLENAGAVVFTPRERDWQRHEVIVDNDQTKSLVSYLEQSFRRPWETTPQKGFAYHEAPYHDGENPFQAGTARMAATTRSKSGLSTVSYQPQLPETGRYAVYVSYQTLEGSIDDAHYTVYHQGIKTEFRVNQQMGGSTWVYLGTFDFDKGSSRENRVVISNQSSRRGIVTTDAVRFGGGMGNIERGGKTSGLPRCLEGARYTAQWAGMPYWVYASKQGDNDYAEDINARSLMTNWLCGGSVFAPDSTGLRVPIELSLAVHSDAGHTETGKGVFGSLAICTTQKGDSLLAAGNSRAMSKELARRLLENTTNDLENAYGRWTMRELYDRNYSETRVPIVPSAIIETLSHQNFGDMCYALDPNFRFTLARSLYKTLLRYICDMHNMAATVQPLTPHNFRIELPPNRRGEAQLSWSPSSDLLEPEAEATGYIVYTAIENGGFDNGVLVDEPEYTVKLHPGMLYHFRVAAFNKGGSSFPTQTLSALYRPEAQQNILVVDAFQRVSSPAIDTSAVDVQGFRLDIDEGVSFGRTAGWLGQQQVFHTSHINAKDSMMLGFSGDELAGRFIAGNNFDHVRTHADAIRHMPACNIVSCSSEALPLMPLKDYALVDVVFGLERDDNHSLMPYKTLTPSMRLALAQCRTNGCSLLVSGSYVGSDAKDADELLFLKEVLKCRPGGSNACTSDSINGLGLSFAYYHQLNEDHYAATHPDMLLPETEGFCAMAYRDETCAAVAYRGTDYRSLTLGFPFECIRDAGSRTAIMQGIMKFLLQ